MQGNTKRLHHANSGISEADATRRTNAAVVLTARAGRPSALGRTAFEDPACQHWARPLVDDVADRRIEMSPDQDGAASLLATTRRVAHHSGKSLRWRDPPSLRRQGRPEVTDQRPDLPWIYHEHWTLAALLDRRSAMSATPPRRRQSQVVVAGR